MSILVSKFLGRSLLVHLLASKAWTLSIISVTSCFYFSLAHFDDTTTCLHNSLKQTRFPFLAQTGFWFSASLSNGMATFGPLGDPILDPILELILDPILASSWSPSWPHLGGPEGWKYCKTQWFSNTFQNFSKYKASKSLYFAGFAGQGVQNKR